MTEKEYVLMCEIMDYIKSNEICYVCDLWHYAENERPDDWFPFICQRKKYSFFKTYFYELRGCMKRKKEKIPPPKHGFLSSECSLEMGEVIK